VHTGCAEGQGRMAVASTVITVRGVQRRTGLAWGQWLTAAGL